jgi:protein-S-isoprenylcysteine O-methyltransferase Ste14
MEQPDSPFRWLLLIEALMVFPVALYYRLRSQTTGEPLDRRQEGAFILSTLRPLGVLWMLGLTAYLIEPRWMSRFSVALPNGLKWTGLVLFGLGGLLLFWALKSLGMNLTDTVVTRKKHTLITTGPYAWVRHPFYDALALFIVGGALAAANWLLLLAGAAVFALIVVRTRKEEENLLARHGDAYLSYFEQTGRFLPRLVSK